MWAKPAPPQLPIHLLQGWHFQHASSVPFRKFDEEVLRTLRGLRPHPLPPLRREAAADTAVSGGEGEDLKEAGGLRPPASFKTSPLPRLDSLLGTLTRAGGGVRGGGGGRPRPFGMLTGRGREAARRDHQPQLVCELMTRDTSRGMKKPLARRRELQLWWPGLCPNHHNCGFLSGTKVFSPRS